METSANLNRRFKARICLLGRRAPEMRLVLVGWLFRQ